METEDPFYLYVTHFIAFLWFSVKTESESHITGNELLLQFHLPQLQLLSYTWQIAIVLDWKLSKKNLFPVCVRKGEKRVREECDGYNTIVDLISCARINNTHFYWVCRKMLHIFRCCYCFNQPYDKVRWNG